MGVYKSVVYGSGVYKSGVYNAGHEDTVTIGGRTYKTVKIGDQVWLAENLDFTFDGLVVGEMGGSVVEPRANYYNNDEATYGWSGLKHGLLYNAQAVSALEAGKASYFPGWHVPTDADFYALFTTVGGSSVAGKKLKSPTGWDADGGGDGATKFNAVPSGYLQFNTFAGVGETGRIRSTQSKRAAFYADSDSVDLTGAHDGIQFSVRLVKDSPVPLLGGPLLGSPNAEADDGE